MHYNYNLDFAEEIMVIGSNNHHQRDRYIVTGLRFLNICSAIGGSIDYMGGGGGCFW